MSADVETSLGREEGRRMNPSTGATGGVPRRVLVPVIALLAVIGGCLSVVFAENIAVATALVIGVPSVAFAIFAIGASTRGPALVVLFALVPLTGILKALTGGRLAPLAFAVGILLVCLGHFFSRMLRRSLPLGLLDWLLGFFLVLAFAQIFNPNVPDFPTGVEGFYKFAFMAIALYAGRHIMEAEDFRRLGNWLLVLCVPISLYAVKQFFMVSSWDQRIMDIAIDTGRSTVNPLMGGGYIRPFSTLPGPFHLGLFLVVTILLTLWRLQDGRLTRLWRVGLLGVLAAQLAALFLTRTKGNWIGLIAGFAVLVLLQARKRPRAVFRFVSAVLAGALCIGVVLSAAASFSDTASRVLHEAVAALNPGESPTIQFRMGLWQDTIIPAIMDQPILGYGTSSAGEGVGVLYENTASASFLSHNLYFKVALELGLIGLALFLTMIGLSLRPRAVRSIEGVGPVDRDWALAVVVAFLVAGCVIPVLDAYPANYYFWLLLGGLSVRKAAAA